MSAHSILRPLLASAVATGITQISRALTEEPKEVAVATAAGAMQVVLDLGSAQPVDQVFVGFTNDVGTGSLQLSYGPATGLENAIAGAMTPAPTKLISPRRHFFKWLPAPITARYIGIAGNVPNGFQIGVIAVGRAFSPALGQEMGNGRGVVDTGSATPRADGGFGIVRGARAATWSWTLGDLTDEEIDDLFALVMDRGETGTVLVVEDLNVNAGVLGEKLHWSLLSRIETYERKDVGITSWAFKLRDWA